MNIDTLDKHLMILLNGPEIEEFNFEKHMSRVCIHDMVRIT